MPTLYNKNLTLAANKGSVVEAAQSFMLMGVKDCAHGARCQLCHQPIRRVAEVLFAMTGERRQVGLDCLERAEFIRRAGREPDQGELATERKLRRTWRSDRHRRPLVASAVAFLRQRRDALPDELRIELDRLELDGVPSSIAAGEALLAYYRQADPLWLLRLVRKTNDLEHWRSRSGTVLAIKVAGPENFRQVRRLSGHESILHVYEGKKYIHVWRYNHETNEVSMQRGNSEWRYSWSQDLFQMQERKGRRQLDLINRLRRQVGWRPLKTRGHTFHFAGETHCLTDSDTLKRAEQEVRNKLR